MQREAKLGGWFALLLGCVGMLTGASILINGLRPTDALSCTALCGLILLIIELFGAFAGTLVCRLLWIAVGALCSLVGFRVLRDKHRA